MGGRGGQGREGGGGDGRREVGKDEAALGHGCLGSLLGNELSRQYCVF